MTRYIIFAIFVSMSARATAYRILALRSCLSKTLREKLLRKGFEESVCDQVIEELTANGYLNDAEYTERSVKRAVERGYGPRYIAQKMKFKGMDARKEVSAISDEEQRAQIHRLLAKRFGSRDRAIRMLERRGFSLAMIFEEVEKFSSK